MFGLAFDPSWFNSIRAVWRKMRPRLVEPTVAQAGKIDGPRPILPAQCPRVRRAGNIEYRSPVGDKPPNIEVKKEEATAGRADRGTGRKIDGPRPILLRLKRPLQRQWPGSKAQGNYVWGSRNYPATHTTSRRKIIVPPPLHLFAAPL